MLLVFFLRLFQWDSLRLYGVNDHLGHTLSCLLYRYVSKTSGSDRSYVPVTHWKVLVNLYVFISCRVKSDVIFLDAVTLDAVDLQPFIKADNKSICWHYSALPTMHCEGFTSYCCSGWSLPLYHTDQRYLAARSMSKNGQRLTIYWSIDPTWLDSPCIPSLRRAAASDRFISHSANRWPPKSFFTLTISRERTRALQITNCNHRT